MSFISDFDALVDCPGLSPAELGLLVYFFRHQGESFVFYRKNILKKFGIKETAYYTALNGLIEKHLISHSQKNSGKFGGLQITVNMSVIRAECEKSESGKTVYGKSAHGNPEHGESESGKSGHNKGVKREGSKKDKEVKAAVAAEGDRLSASAGAAASEAAPAAAAAADSPSPEISRSQDNKPRQSSKAAKASKAAAIPLSQNPPTQTDVETCISRLVSASPKKDLWNPGAVSAVAFEIWNKYTLNGWTRKDGTQHTSLDSLVFIWLKYAQWMPPEVPAPAPHPSPVPAASPAPNELSGLLPGQWAGTPIQKPQQKSFKQQERDWIQRPLTDPDSVTVENAAWCIFNACCEDEVQGTLNSIPAHLHERALALAEQMRKEQGDRPRIITPSTFTYENEDEPS